MEKLGTQSLKVTVDSKELAEVLYKEVAELQEKENSVKRNFV